MFCRALVLVALGALALTFTPIRADAAPPQGAPETYVVQPGDTLFVIATRYHTTVAAIKQLNGLGTSDLIQVGQKLLIPTGDAPAPATTAAPYIVQPDDTLYRIALRHGTTVRALQDLNTLANPNLIAPGQAIAIPHNTDVVKPGLLIDPPVGTRTYASPWVEIRMRRDAATGNVSVIRAELLFPCIGGI